MKATIIALSLLVASSATAAVRETAHPTVSTYTVVPAKSNPIDFSKPYWFVTLFKPMVDLLVW